MSNGALRWIRTLAEAARSSAPPRIAEDQTGIRRVSLLPDDGEAHASVPAPDDDEPPMFAAEERATRLSQPGDIALRAPERRNSSRAPWLADLEFAEDAQFFTGLSLDISEGGLFVATYTPIPIGTRLVLCFELPDGTSVEARGEVRWVRPEAMDGERPGVGIKFTELPPDVRERIADICARQQPLYFDT
jgi:uncharacterized protein (TIGR02266 family)